MGQRHILTTLAQILAKTRYPRWTGRGDRALSAARIRSSGWDGEEDKPVTRGPPISGTRWEGPGGGRSDVMDPPGSECERISPYGAWVRGATTVGPACEAMGRVEGRNGPARVFPI
jgi:hypothetical protein